MWKWKITNIVKGIFNKLFSKRKKIQSRHGKRTDKRNKDIVIPKSDNHENLHFTDNSENTSVSTAINTSLPETTETTKNTKENLEVYSDENSQVVDNHITLMPLMTKEIVLAEEIDQVLMIPSEEFQISDIDDQKNAEVHKFETLELKPTSEMLDELPPFVKENLEQVDDPIEKDNGIGLIGEDESKQNHESLLVEFNQEDMEEDESEAGFPLDLERKQGEKSEDFESVFKKFIDSEHLPIELDLPETMDQYFIGETISEPELEISESLNNLDEEVIKNQNGSPELDYEITEESIIENPQILDSRSDVDLSSESVQEFSVDSDEIIEEKQEVNQPEKFESDLANEQQENQIDNAENELMEQWTVDIEKMLIEIAKESKQKKKTTKKRRRKFFYDYHDLPKKNKEEIKQFLIDLEDPTGNKVQINTIDELEVFFLNCLGNNTLIGELPISKNSFLCIGEMIYKNFRKIKSTHPGLFVVSMVFCARYSEDEMRNFWEPYSNMVWREDNSQYFQIQCRQHFFDCREFLSDQFGMNFPAKTQGDVVKPVYFHAVIPYYLQSSFAEWLLQNFDNLLAYSVEDLPVILKSDQSTKYIPPRLKTFIESTETNLVAASLIRQMAKAVKLYKDTEQYDTVYSIMDSPIQRALWKDIYTNLIKDKSIIGKVRHYSPKINWVWDTDEEDVFLSISNVRSSKEEKPNMFVWAGNNSYNLKTEPISADVYPYMLSNGDWEVETTILQQCGDIDGIIYLLSDEFDLEQPIVNQGEHIVLSANIPNLNEELIYFFINGNSSISQKRETIDSNGVWLIGSKEEFEIENFKNEKVDYSQLFIPQILNDFGFTTLKKYTIDLPVKLITNTQTSEFTKGSNKPILEVSILGENQIKQANNVPPVFQSKQIELTLKSSNNDVLKTNFNRIWLSIYQGGKFEQSVLLSELLNYGDIVQGENNFIVKLKRFINKSGSFSLNFLLDLRTLLDEPIRFSYLPEIILTPPDPETQYSPNDPAEIIVQNLPHHYIKKFSPDNVKIVPSGEKVFLRWKIMKEAVCRFNVQWEGNNIPFYWNIKRITAWAEGTNDNNEIFESDFPKTKLFVRGYPHDDIQWILPDNQVRNYQLNSKGSYEEILDQMVLRDMLLKSNKVKTELSINIKNQKWNVLTFIQKPLIKITKVNYHDKKLKIKIDQQRTLVGDYKLKVTNIEKTIEYDLISEENLKNDYQFDRLLLPGTYQVELYSFDELISTSDKFVIEEERSFIGITSQVKILNRKQNYTPKVLFENLSLSQNEINNLQSKSNIDNLLPYLQQLIKIHTKSEWVTNEKYSDGLKQLLPSWAVIDVPLRFISNVHRKILHIFPQRLVYGTRFGKGYANLKLEDELVKVYAAWSSIEGQDHINLWLMIPKETNNYSFYDLSELDLWPAYQCIDCGELVGSREGSYLKLPPNTIKKHIHGHQRKIDDQFVDIMYTKHMQGTLTQYYETKLSHCEKVEKIIGRNTLQDLLANKKTPIKGNLPKPISFENSTNYECAIAELVENYRTTNAKFYLQQLLGKSNEFKIIDQFIQKNQIMIPAYSAFLRLVTQLKANQQIEYMPKYILMLSMILRTKANNPENYFSFVVTTQISEEEIINLVDLADKSCPKLLEWSLAWAELFFVHTIS